MVVTPESRDAGRMSINVSRRGVLKLGAARRTGWTTRSPMFERSPPPSGWRRFDLVGHDRGAAVGWIAAARYSRRIRTLTAVSVPHLGAFAEALRVDPAQQAGHHDYHARRTDDGWRFDRLVVTPITLATPSTGHSEPPRTACGGRVSGGRDHSRTSPGGRPRKRSVRPPGRALGESGGPGPSPRYDRSVQL
jgi:pimeloyl-ACP methyl ester carboxylesterase